MSDGSGGVVAPPVDLEEVDLEDIFHRVWNRVVGQANKLLEAHERFGFVHFTANLNPTLPEILEAFATIDFVLSKMVDSGFLRPEEAMSAINSRQCILKMRALSLALDSNDQEAFERVIQELRMHS